MVEVVLPAGNLEETVDFFVSKFGFRLERISPADAPAIAVIEGHGCRLLFDVAATTDPGMIAIDAADIAVADMNAGSIFAPNGTEVVISGDRSPLDLPDLEPSLVVTRSSPTLDWGSGRAEMQYRDLIPGRLGGRYLASHIRIPDGGPVPDYVHHHGVRFQMIYCHRGWVDVVYEDQGPPFRLESGDLVLQPPHIRHRVLVASAGLEVVEIGSPAVHDTFADHVMELPTSAIDPEHNFDGQTFCRYIADQAIWAPDGFGFVASSSDVAAATNGLADVMILRPAEAALAQQDANQSHNGELLFFFVAAGSVRCSLVNDGPLLVGDTVVVPAQVPFAFSSLSNDLQLLRVRVN